MLALGLVLCLMLANPGFATLMWRPIIMTQDFLDYEFPNYSNKRISSSSDLICALQASRIPWSVLFRYESGTCTVTSMLMFPTKTEVQLTNSLQFYTRYSPEDMKCVKDNAMFYSKLGCIWVTDKKLNYSEASQECQALNGNLISLALFKTRKEVLTFATQFGLLELVFWVGASKPDSSYPMTWVTGEALEDGSFFWANGQPSRPDYEFCVKARKDKRLGDEECRDENFGVCTYPRTV